MQNFSDFLKVASRSQSDPKRSVPTLTSRISKPQLGFATPAVQKKRVLARLLERLLARLGDILGKIIGKSCAKTLCKAKPDLLK